MFLVYNLNLTEMSTNKNLIAESGAGVPAKKESLHIKSLVDRIRLTANTYESRMSGQKHTPLVVSKLNSLAKALSADFDTQADLSEALVNIILEVSEHLSKLDDYAEKFNKLNFCQKKTNPASEIRHKIQMHANAISNYKLLIEALTSMPSFSPSATQKQQQHALLGASNVLLQGSGGAYAGEGNDDDETIMSRVQECEERLERFIRRQEDSETNIRQRHFNAMPSSEAKPNDKRDIGIENKRKRRQNGQERLQGVAEEKKGPGTDKKRTLNMDNSNLTLIGRDEADADPLPDEEKILLDVKIQLSGLRGAQNIDEAINSLRQIENYPRALFTRGELYDKGIGNRVDPERALDYFKKAADKGEPNAKLKLARLFLSNSTTQDEQNENQKIAFQLFKEAADTELPEAEAQLGAIFDQGGYEDEKTGKLYPLCKPNREKAISLYQKAAAADNETAFNHLGKHAFNTDNNYTLAVEYFRKASESEMNARAINNLAMCFEQGIGVQQDYQMALQMYEKSAKLGYAPSMVNRAYLLYKEGQNAQRDKNDELAQELFFDCTNWLRMALAHNEDIRDALYLMGIMYEKGYSVEQNLKASFDCYLKAANLNHPSASTKVGHCFYSGVKEKSQADNYMVTITSFETADSIDTEPHFIVPPDRKMALQHYLKAGQLGESEACNCIGLILEKENSIDAVSFYQKALEFDEKNTNAMFNMAMLYLNDQEEAEWHDEAITMVRKAVALGNIQAKEYMKKLRQRGKNIMSQQQFNVAAVSLKSGLTTMGGEELKQPYLSDTDRDGKSDVTISVTDGDLSYTKTHLGNALQKEMLEKKAELTLKKVPSQDKVVPQRPMRLKKQNSVQSGGSQGSGGSRPGTGQAAAPVRKNSVQSRQSDFENTDINDRISMNTGSDDNIF